MQQIRQLTLMLIPLLLIFSGCTTLPDIKPFADSTASLAAAAGSHYREVASDHASLDLQNPPNAPLKNTGESNADYAARKLANENLAVKKKEEHKENEKIIAATDKNLTVLFDAMTTYSEKLASLAAAGKTGPEAGQSILDSLKGFSALSGMSGLGSVADPIVKAFKAIADEFTKMEAKKSLKEAVAAAEPGVNLVANQFEIIYGKDGLDLIDSGIRNFKLEKAENIAGSNVIGFNETVMRRYNAYYQRLIGIIDKEESTPWHGFCRGKTNEPCLAISELEAVGLVEARMAAIRPIVDEYKAEIATINATLKHRRSIRKAIIKSVKAWSLEHQKLRRSLEDGTSLSSLNLKAALIELNNLLGQKP